MTSKLESAIVSPRSPDQDCFLNLTCTEAQPSPARSEATSTPVKPVQVQKKRGPRKSRKRLRAEEEDEESEEKRLIANTQERVRMQKMNKALDELKNALPPHFHAFQKRMSKIRTLRLAMNYIAWLSDLIQKDNARREAAYRHTLQFIQEQGCIPQFSPDGALMSSIYPYTPDTVPTTPVYYTPAYATPYHAYVSSLHGLANSSAFETPVQNPPRRQPRQLDFFSTPRQDQLRSSETLVAGTIENPVKIEDDNCAQMNSEKDNFVETNAEPGEIVTPRISKLQKFHKTETFISPFLASRNQNELDLSFLSTGSDSNRDDIECCARGKTLADIIDGSSSDDDVHGDGLGVQMWDKMCKVIFIYLFIYSFSLSFLKHFKNRGSTWRGFNLECEMWNIIYLFIYFAWGHEAPINWNLACNIKYSSTTKFVQMMPLGWPWPIFLQGQICPPPSQHTHPTPMRLFRKKVKTMDLSETIMVYDIKVGRCSQLKWVHEALWVPKVNVIHWHWSKSLRSNIFKLLCLNNHRF